MLQPLRWIMPKDIFLTLVALTDFRNNLIQELDVILKFQLLLQPLRVYPTLLSAVLLHELFVFELRIFYISYSLHLDKIIKEFHFKMFLAETGVRIADFTYLGWGLEEYLAFPWWFDDLCPFGELLVGEHYVSGVCNLLQV